jgi:hypothetical protein
MASVVINGDTSGAVTISAPAVAGTTTLTLPTTSGTVLTTATSTGISGSAISSGTVPEAYGGTGTSTGYYGFKNRIINGAMVIDQRNAGASVTPTADAYTLDRWTNGMSQASKMTIQQSSTVPSGFSKSLSVTVASAYTPAASEWFGFFQKIEGFNSADLGFGAAGASTVTISFWVRSSITGSYGFSLSNSSQNRSYPVLYTVNSANTWEQKTITIPGDTSGTWVGATNGIGMLCIWSLGAGSSFLQTANAWGTGLGLGTTGQTNWITNAGATFFITGVQLEKGSTATSFDYRPYGTELQLCQRYFAKMGQGSASFAAFGAGMYNTTTGTNLFLKYPTTMRVSPTLSYGGAIQVTSGATGNVITAINNTYMGLDSCLWQPSGMSGTLGYGAVILGNSDNTCFVAFSAEL